VAHEQLAEIGTYAHDHAVEVLGRRISGDEGVADVVQP
jgi:hypothetical protein